MHKGTWRDPKLQNFKTSSLPKPVFCMDNTIFSTKGLKIGVFALFRTYIYTYILLGGFGRGHPIPPTSSKYLMIKHPNTPKSHYS